MTPTIQLPLLGLMAGFRRFSVGEYHRLIQMGILTEDDNLELLEGHLVLKMSRNPPHDTAIQLTSKRLAKVLPAGWDVRIQMALTLSDSEPEPDVAVVRGDERTYVSRHPGATDTGLVIEASDSTLEGDRADKGRIYARANLPCYWIINVREGWVEVYTSPSGPTATPAYAQRQDYKAGDVVPFFLDGRLVANIPVVALLP